MVNAIKRVQEELAKTQKRILEILRKGSKKLPAKKIVKKKPKKKVVRKKR